mgnify:CR=1 FL=1
MLGWRFLSSGAEGMRDVKQKKSEPHGQLFKKNEKLIYLIMRECKSGFTAQLSTMKNTLVNDLILQRYT